MFLKLSITIRLESTMSNLRINLSTVLLLMLLWLIGGSPPVRARRKIPYYQSPDSNTQVYNYELLHNNTSGWRKQESKVTNKNNLLQQPKMRQDEGRLTHNNSLCSERRTLRQIVIDTPSIVEVNVVSKSVAGKQAAWIAN